MGNKYIWLAIAASILAFVAGFLLANTINRSELDSLRAEIDRAQAARGNSSAGNSAEQELSEAEIRAKIAEADQNPTNFGFQKGLGIALYRYGNYKQDPLLLKDAIRLLERADGISKQDREVKIALGNAYFDVAYYEKTGRTATVDVINKNFATARKYYDESLAIRPDDAGVVTDVGLTYFLQEPPEYLTASKHLESALKLEPLHERAIQFLVETKWRLGDTGQAAGYLEQLKSNYPKNPMIPELTSMLMRSPANQ